MNTCLFEPFSHLAEKWVGGEVTIYIIFYFKEAASGRSLLISLMSKCTEVILEVH